MRHLPYSPVRSGSGAPHTGPAIAGPESLREIVHSIEVLDPVAVLPGEEAHVNEHEDDAAEILRSLDAPVGDDGRSELAALLQREIAARPPGRSCYARGRSRASRPRAPPRSASLSVPRSAARGRAGSARRSSRCRCAPAAGTAATPAPSPS